MASAFALAFIFPVISASSVPAANTAAATTVGRIAETAVEDESKAAESAVVIDIDSTETAESRKVRYIDATRTLASTDSEKLAKEGRSVHFVDTKTLAAGDATVRPLIKMVGKNDYEDSVSAVAINIGSMSPAEKIKVHQVSDTLILAGAATNEGAKESEAVQLVDTTTQISEDTTAEADDILILKAVAAGEEASAWRWPSIVSTIVLACCCCIPCSICCYAAVSDVGSSPKPFERISGEVIVLPITTDLRLIPRDDASPNDKLMSIVRGELYFTMVIPFCSAIFWFALSEFFECIGAGAAAEWMQVFIAAPAIFRACVMEKYLISLSRSQDEETTSVWKLFKEDLLVHMRRFSAPFILSKFELTDAITDGLSMVIVFMLECKNDLFHRRLLAAWGAGPVGRLFAPLVIQVGLSSMMLVVQVIATCAQTCICLAAKPNKAIAPASELAGLGAFSFHCLQGTPTSQISEQEFVTFSKDVARVIFEGAPQLVLQSSAVLAEGKGLLNQPSLAFSILVTISTLCKKYLEISFLVCKNVWPRDAGDAVVFMGYHIILLPLPLGVVSVILRLAMAEVCESHLFDAAIWECVPAPHD